MLDEEAFKGWLAHPATREVRKYLRDYQTSLMRAWGEGQEMRPYDQCLAQCLGDLAELNFDDYRNFYDEQTQGSTEPDTD